MSSFFENSNLYIPEKIKVGYQERLAYVIYYDHTGKLRKEPSWRNWIDSGCDGREWSSEKKNI